MKHIKFLMLLCAAFVLKDSFAQSVYQIRADTVKILKVGGSAELVLQNKTKDSLGYLLNLGNGKTEFRRAKKIDNSHISIGLDTFDIGSGSALTDSLTSPFIPYFDGLILKNSPISWTAGTLAVRGDNVLYIGGVGPHSKSYISLADTAGNSIYNIGEESAITGSGTPDDFLFFHGLTSGNTKFISDDISNPNLIIRHRGVKIFHGNASNRISSPTDGDTYYDDDSACLVIYKNVSLGWRSICSSATFDSTTLDIHSDGYNEGKYVQRKDSIASVTNYVTHYQEDTAKLNLRSIISPKLDSVRRSNDSIYESYASGLRRLAYTDSLGEVITTRIIGPIDTPSISKRADAPAIIRLWDDSLLCVWSEFPGPNTADVSASILVGKKSKDGKTWSTKFTVMPIIAGLNSSTPSLKLNPTNGDVMLVFNIKYNTVQLTSTLAVAKSTNNGRTFTVIDSLLKNQNDYFYTKSDCIEESPGTKRWFLPYGKITNRGSAFFIGKFMYSDDYGLTWTNSSQVFVSPDSIVNEPGIYITPRFPKTVTVGEFVRFYYSNQTKSQIYEYQSINNGTSWSTSPNVTGLQSPYAQPAFKIFDRGLRGIAVVNTLTGAPNQAAQRQSLSLWATSQEGHFNDIGNALTLGHNWKDIGPLVFADQGYTVFEPCIYVDSARKMLYVGISKFDSLFTVSDVEVISMPLSRARAASIQNFSVVNIKPSGLEFEANQGFFNIWNDQYGYADNHLSVKTLSSATGDANFYWEWKNHNNSTATGMLWKMFPAVDNFTAYYSHLLTVQGGSAISNLGYFGCANSAGTIVYDIGPSGQVGIGAQFSANAWLKLPAPTSTFAQMLLPAGTTRTTLLQGQLQDSLGIVLWDSSGSARRWLLSKQWADNLYAPIGTGAYYQTLQINGSNQTQRAKLNLSDAFTNTDNSGSGSSDISLIPAINRTLATSHNTGRTTFGATTLSSAPADGQYEAGGNIIINTVTSATIHLEVTYTDLNNASHTINVYPIGTNTDATVAGTYLFPTVSFSAKSGTSITVATNGTITTSINYDWDMNIKRIF